MKIDIRIDSKQNYNYYVMYAFLCFFYYCEFMKLINKKEKALKPLQSRFILKHYPSVTNKSQNRLLIRKQHTHT